MDRIGIYIIENLPTGMCYVGQSNDIPVRWMQHKRELQANKHHCPYLQRLWNEHGDSQFAFRIVRLPPAGMSSLETQRWLVKNERALYHEFKKYDKCLNSEVPEIVDTKQALAEFEIENQIRIVSENKEITNELRQVRADLSEEQAKRVHFSTALKNQEREIKILKKAVKRNKGWRAFLFGRNDPRPQSQLESELASAESNIQRFREEFQAVEARITSLQEQRRFLYNSYPRKAKRRRDRFMNEFRLSRPRPRIEE